MDFYDQLALFYGLIYGDWNTAVETRAVQLAAIICECLGE
jgi:hypothetical protein